MKAAKSEKYVVVVGAGLGGMSAAIMLAQAGFKVTVLEKNDQVGGKLNLLEKQGFKFDLGPSIFTLPQVFRPVFEGGGKRLEDYVSLQRVDPQWRNFFDDGTVVNLHERTEDMRAELSRLGNDVFEEYQNFLAYSRQQYEVIERGYFREGVDTFSQFIKFYGMKEARSLDYLNTMSGSIRKRVKNPYLRNIFEYFIAYAGSSPAAAPGVMNLMPNIQLEFGLWYVKGGLYELARAFQKRLAETGVDLRLGCEVRSIEKERDTVVSVLAKPKGGPLQTFDADYIVSNVEVVPAMERLLMEPRQVVKKMRRFEPSSSGIILHLGLDRVYPQLAHHNFFYSKDQQRNFKRVFREKKLPDDPTIYVAAPTRTDPTQAPPRRDNIKILSHIPYINDKHPYTREDCIALKELCLDKLERMGLTDLRKHIVVEDFWTPFDIEERYASNRGSIYGVVTDRRRNFAFKAPKRSRQYRNMFFVGGSVNPGGGMPMVTLSGQHVARMIEEQHDKAPS